MQVNDLVALTLSGAFIYSRPTVTVTDGVTLIDRRVTAATVRVGTGVGIKIF